MRPALEVKNITKNFTHFFAGQEQKIEVIKSANFSVKKGEIISLVGPSGSGKTTLLQIIGLLDSPTSGEVFIDGKGTLNANDEIRTEIRKNHIGFVFQSHHLLPEFSALENVALPLLIQGKNRTKAFELAEKILVEVELKDRINHKPSELSGGQQQRVSLARAVVSKPSLILADEPTGNLDSTLSVKIFTLLQDLVKKYEIGCVTVTHNIELANRTDRVITIKDGEIF